MFPRIVGLFFAVISIGGADEPVSIHGTLQQSYVLSTKNDFLFRGTKGGSLEFTEATLNATKQVDDRLRVGAQLLSREFGQEGNFATVLDWGYGDYQLNGMFGLRAGKVRLPLGLYNEYRDVDAGRTEILLQQGLYPEGFRALSLAYNGLGVYGNLGENSSFGSLDYHLYYGSLTVPEDFLVLKPLQAAFNMSTSIEVDQIDGGQFQWNTPVEGLRLSYSVFQLDGYWDVKSPALFYSPLYSNFNVPEGIDFELLITGTGLEYQREKWTLAAEFQNMKMRSAYSPAFQTAFSQPVAAAVTAATTASLTPTLGSVAAGQAGQVAGQAAGQAALGGISPILTGMNTDSFMWYGSATYQFTDRYSQFLSYGITYSDKSNKSSKASYRKDFGLGFRYDLSNHWRFKLEGHHFDGGSGAILTTGSTRVAQSYQIFLGRLAFDF